MLKPLHHSAQIVRSAMARTKLFTPAASNSAGYMGLNGKSTILGLHYKCFRHFSNNKFNCNCYFT